MDLLDAIRGLKRPPVGTPAQPAAALREALLALGSDADPYDVRWTARGEPGEIVAEWRIVDARWLELFAAAGMTKTFAVFLALDEIRSQVRALDRSTSLEWRAGIPSPALGGEVQWGRQMTFDAAVGFGLRTDLTFGQTYRYRFRSSDLKRPLWTATLAHGWSWRAVGPGGL